MHFPQIIIFRLNMMFAGSALMMAWLGLYWWLNKVNTLIGNPIKISSSYFWLGEIGTFFFFLTIASIDDGYMNMDFH